MRRKQPESEDMASSSEEEAEGEEEDEEESGSESSDDDEFDSADDRVTTIPAETSNQVNISQEDSSEESQSSAESEGMKLAMKSADSTGLNLQTQQNTGDSEKHKTFDSDVESEYESESSSESAGLTQKSPKRIMSEMETSPRMEIKVQKDDFHGKKGMSESDQVVNKGKDKALKQQQNPPSKIVKNEVLKQVQEGQHAKKGQEGALKQVLKNDDQSQSVKNEKIGGLSAKKRKLESLQHDGETDSVDSVPIATKKNNTNAAHNDKMGADRNKPAAPVLSDTHKEVARKTLNDPTVRANGVKDVQRKASTNAAKQPASPQKQKKPHLWSTGEEITMASEVLNHVRMGLEVPSKRNDDFWLTLSEILQEKLGIDFSREQLSEKMRRMKQRYHGAMQRIKECQESQKQFKHKNSSEQELFEIWSQIWGRAEVTSLKEHEETASDVKDLGKPGAVKASPVREGKNDGQNTPKTKLSSKAKANKEAMAATIRDASQVDRITAEPMELDKSGAAQEDHGRDERSSPADGSVFLSKDVHKLVSDKIHATLHELQEWLKSSMEEWMNKALTLFENTGKSLGDQARCMNGIGVAGPVLPMRIGNPMEPQFVHGEQAFQQQWYELHLQELNIYGRRLELMRKECELKQEQVKLQLQLEREK